MIVPNMQRYFLKVVDTAYFFPLSLTTIQCNVSNEILNVLSYECETYLVPDDASCNTFFAYEPKMFSFRTY